MVADIGDEEAAIGRKRQGTCARAVATCGTGELELAGPIAGPSEQALERAVRREDPNHVVGTARLTRMSPLSGSTAGE